MFLRNKKSFIENLYYKNKSILQTDRLNSAIISKNPNMKELFKFSKIYVSIFTLE